MTDPSVSPIAWTLQIVTATVNEDMLSAVQLSTEATPGEVRHLASFAAAAVDVASMVVGCTPQQFMQQLALNVAADGDV